MLPTGYPEPFERLRLQSKPQYNMGASSDNAPVNQGGPGNPGGANNIARLPRFFGQRNNKGPAPLTPADIQMQSNIQQGVNSQYNKPPAPAGQSPSWGGGAGGQWNGDFSQFARNPQQTMTDQWQQQGQRQQQDEWNRLPPEERARYDADTQRRMGGNSGIMNYWNQQGANSQQQYPTHPAFPTPQLPSPDNWTRPMQPGTGGQNGQRPPGMGLPPFRQQQQQREDMFQPQYPMQSQDPYNIYGAAGQSPQLGRYRPPMMENAENPQDWMGGAGGYSYNIPNSYGSSQWNQFNSTDRPFPGFGQAQPPQFGGTQQGTYDPRTNRYYGGPVQQQPQGNSWLASLFGPSNPYQMQAPQPVPQPQAPQPPNATMPGVPGDGFPPG